MKFTDKQYEELINNPQNEWFKKPEEEKYAEFAGKDPFPEIEDALLNANDVVKYVAVAGIISPFKPDQLSGVTYTARFSGNIYHYEPGGKLVCQNLIGKESYTLQPNSINFLEIDTYFRVPHYMVLRYNLRVKNVYKGLLLGTGPIIDSGFQGRFFIPLHNLTSNAYVIQKGAKLIDIEFTKLSLRPDWEIKKGSTILKTVKQFDFSAVPQISNDFTGTNENRPFSFYVENALTKDSDFHNENNEIFVYSSVHDLKNQLNEGIRQNAKFLEDTADNLDKKSKQAISEVNALLDKSERRENFIKSFSILTVIAMLITAITLGITAWDYFNKATDLQITCQHLEQSIEYNEQRIETIQLIVDALENDSEISEELNEQYHKLLEQISEAINELAEQRDSSKHELVHTNKIVFWLSVVAIIFAAFAVSYLCIYKTVLRIKNDKKSKSDI